jgi:predicted glycosyltransferase
MDGAHSQIDRAESALADLRAESFRPKILLYSHDTFGLGNIHRTLLLSDALRRAFPGAAVLIITGSPVIHALRIPAAIDYLKLPSLDRVAADRYEPRFLSTLANEVKGMRRAIIRRAALGFDPDIMIVDKRPLGVDGELAGTLSALRRLPHPVRIVLGMRDILDEPARTRRSFGRTHAFATIEHYYDEVWIYGARAVFDAVSEYAFPEAVARKTIFSGYLSRPTAPSTPNGRAPRVLVTTGGGGDGSDVVDAYLEGLLGLPRRLALHTTIVFGPDMPEQRRQATLERFGHLPDVAFFDFEPDLVRRYAEADVVVSMAGYSTVSELLSWGRRAVLVPRAAPVREQLIRARRFADLGYFDIVEPEELEPSLLIGKVLAALEREPTPSLAVDLNGLPRIVERVQAMLGEMNGRRTL